MHSIEWLENGREFVPIIDGWECPLPDPRSMNFQTVLSILEAEDIVDYVRPMRLAEWKRELVFNRWRACYDLPEFDIAYHVTYLVDHFRSEIVADFAPLGLELGELWRGRKWQTIFDLISGLPSGAATTSALAMDEEHAKIMASQILDNEEGEGRDAEKEMSLRGWSSINSQLADIYDAVLSVGTTVIAVNATTPPKPPEQYPRPKSALEKEISRQRIARREEKHRDLVSRVLKK